MEDFVTERVQRRRMMVGEGCRKVMAGIGGGRYLTGNRKVAGQVQVTVMDVCPSVLGRGEEKTEEENATTNDRVRKEMGKSPESLTGHCVTKWEQESMKDFRAIETPSGEDPSSDERKGPSAGHFAANDGRGGGGTMQRRAHGLRAGAEFPSYLLGPPDDLVCHLYISVHSNASLRHQVRGREYAS